MGDITLALPNLHSERCHNHLKAISSLRKRGIGEHIGLPQLIVCGDQSAGKSSVLEGVSGFPFPRQDGLCTRFATEIILQDDPGSFSATVSIIPHSSRSNESKERMTRFFQTLGTFEDLPGVIIEAGTIMGIRGFPDVVDGPAFGQDVLQVRVSGPTGLHLSVVDLPGIIQVPSEDQTEDDVRRVHDLVDSYMQNERSIILAVVQAGNDIANQPVICKSKKFDPSGGRTVGIITKPDLINKGAEVRIAQLARNEDSTKLKLGFFLLKNPTPEDLARGISIRDRQELESRYFQSPPWKDQHLDPDRVGVSSLKMYLQGLLDHHIEEEIPKVRQELQTLERRTYDQILRMGKKRKTTTDMRIYLSSIAMDFGNTCLAALQGNYSDEEVFGIDTRTISPARLRAVVHRLNVNFSNDMRTAGSKFKVAPGSIFDELEQVDDGQGDQQTSLTESQMQEWVKEVYTVTRGQELPGDYNHVFLATLFRRQSSRWYGIASRHLRSVCDCLDQFFDLIITQVTEEEHTRVGIREGVILALDEKKRKAEDELRELWDDECEQPITYNHYYTDNVQKSRHSKAQDALTTAMKETTDHDYNGKIHISNNKVDIENLLNGLKNRIVVNMDAQACSEARASLDAYYKVARKTFVDNVCRQVIERHLLRGLPKVFSPETVAAYSDDELRSIAGESQAKSDKRDSLCALHEALKAGIRDLLR